MFVVASVFKNEAPLLREWVEHYLLDEGAAHLFLVDHGSTDAPKSRVEDYADRITWFADARPFEPGIQATLLNEHVLPKVKGGKCWVLVCDVDEYLYSSPLETTVGQTLLEMPAHVSKVWVPWKVFGGNGHRDAQPGEGVVQGFTRRAQGVSLPYKRVAAGYESHLGLGKMLARGVLRLGVHESEVEGGAAMVHGWDRHQTPAHLFQRLPPPHLTLLELNHYMYMSRMYYAEVKCARGGGQTGHATGKYTLAYYDATEPGCNAVVDDALARKKKKLTTRV